MAQNLTHDSLLQSDDSRRRKDAIVHSRRAVVASEDGRCSEIGVSMLRKGGHAVDAAIATTLALGVVSQMWSGIGGGDFIVIHSSSAPGAVAIDARETAPAAASENMYADNPDAKSKGPLSVAVPGKIAGMHAAWLKYGKLPWKTLFEPAIKLAKDGFVISPFEADSLAARKDIIMADPGMRHVYAPGGRVLKAGEMCHNVELGKAMEEIAEHGPKAFYGGAVGRKLVEDVRKGGGILTLDDLRNYQVRITDALKVNSMGFTIYGMPPPSAGTVGLAMILNILQSYGSPNAFDGPLGLHRFIEALKHMFAIRMGLGDPDFANITETVSRMLSPSYAQKIRERILDNTTFPPDYYMPRWNQPREHGTSHLCVVDEKRNVVSLTASVNNDLGSGVLSPSTGIVLNNQMDDFSIPTDVSPCKPPPAPPNFIRPNKRPLSSMTPIIIFKDNHLVGVLGGSGGITITPGIVQVFLNHFISEMEPLAAVKSARVYHRLIPNIVFYENWTVVDGEHIELSKEKKVLLKGKGHDLQDVPFLVERGHWLHGVAAGAYCNLVVQKGSGFHGMLTAVSDLRKGGFPAAL